MKNEIATLDCARNDKPRLIAAPQKARLATTDPLTLPLPLGERIKVRGFTLIEVVLAVVVITIAVSATLVIMAKMMGYTINRGQAVDISNAVTVSQIAIDRVRDQKFPPTGTYGILESTSVDSSITISNLTYTYSINIVAYDGVITAAQYGSANGDLIQGNRNLLKVTVTVSKNGRQILKTVTYKTRNGYY